LKPEIKNRNNIIFTNDKGVVFNWTSEFEIRDANYYQMEDLVVAIVQKIGDKQALIGINLDGSKRFDVAPPDDWFLYYLSSHIDYNISVVCVSDKERFDWHFGVSATTGEVTSLNRAY